MVGQGRRRAPRAELSREWRDGVESHRKKLTKEAPYDEKNEKTRVIKKKKKIHSGHKRGLTTSSLAGGLSEASSPGRGRKSRKKKQTKEASYDENNEKIRVEKKITLTTYVESRRASSRAASQLSSPSLAFRGGVESRGKKRTKEAPYDEKERKSQIYKKKLKKKTTRAIRGVTPIELTGGFRAELARWRGLCQAEPNRTGRSLRGAAGRGGVSPE